MRERRPIIAGLAIAALTTLAILVGGGLTSPRPTAPTASATASAQAMGGGGPVVFYEVDDADGSELMVRTLDGRSLARVVAGRADIAGARTWSVDPTGSIAIAATTLPEGGTRLEAVSVATGETAWSVEAPPTGVAEGVWSTDGRRFATATESDNPANREALVVDTTTGRFDRTPISNRAALQGFDPTGALIVRERRPGVVGEGNAGWRFLRLDPSSGVLELLVVLPDVGPASSWSEDVDPAAGIGFDQAVAPTDETKVVLRMWSVAADTSQVIATFPTVDRLAIDPAGRAVAVGVQDSIFLVGQDGRAAEVWSGKEPPSWFEFSGNGTHLAVATDQVEPHLFVVERASGRSVELPLPAAIARAAFVRIVDTAAIPAIALPAVEPTPTPTPAPSGADLATSDGVLVAWLESMGGQAILHVERRVPTQDGGMRTVAAMGPANVGPSGIIEDERPAISLVPRPGSHDVLVWVLTPDGTHAWLWAGDGPRRHVPLPPDWPATTYDLAWRPDGKALAASATLPDATGEPRDVFVVAPLNGRKTTVVPLPRGGAYNRLEGWWSKDELQLGHGICAEGCSGRYAWSARYGVVTHKLRELTAADRSRGPIDTIVSTEPSGLDLLLGNEMPDRTIHIAWPEALGKTGPDLIGYAADGRSLVVSTKTAQGTDVYRIDDPAARAVAGSLTDPAPTLLGHLARKGIDIRISPDEHWALVTDRTEGIELVELATGRAWPIDRGTTTTWAPSGG